MLKGWLKMKDRRGQALVEFVLIIPIFLLLVFGIIEFGRIFSSQLIVSNASRGGARIVAVNDLDTTTLTNTVKDMCFTMDKTKVTMQAKYYKQDGTLTGTRTPGGSVLVEVSYPVTIYAPIIREIIDTNEEHEFTVKAETTMHVE